MIIYTKSRYLGENELSGRNVGFVRSRAVACGLVVANGHRDLSTSVGDSLRLAIFAG